MPQFRKKPVVIEAHEVTADTRASVALWCGGQCGEDEDGPLILIETLEGDMTARIGDWVIKGVKGEFYPCRADIFEATYDPANEAVTDHDVEALFRGVLPRDPRHFPNVGGDE